MFREWIELFKEKNLLEDVFADYRGMLENASWIFHQTYTVILENGDLKALEAAVGERIARLEKAEQEIRRRIATHLVMSGGHLVGTSLVIFRNAHDVLRLGELCRDLEDIATLGKVDFPDNFRSDIKGIFATIDASMKDLVEAVASSKVASVRKIIAKLDAVSANCQGLIEKIMKEFDGPVMVGVETAMTLRFSNRIARNLVNIAKGVAADPAELD